MNLHFQPSKNAWFHNQHGESYIWGFDGMSLNSRQPAGDAITFPVKVSGHKIGPLIGILTGQSDAFLFEGNRNLFKGIQKRLMACGGISIVFTPEGMTKQYVNGFLYIPNKNSWVKARTPIPDVVYNRIPDRIFERSNTVQSLLDWLKRKQLPFFNPHFFSKWETFQLLQGEPELRKHLPDTRLLKRQKDVLAMLKKHRSIYLKPDEGLKGNGIMVLNHHRDGIELLTQLGDRVIPEEKLWERIFPMLNRERYIIQEYIPLQTLRGRPYDFRVLVHRLHSDWHITAIGVRQAAKNGITTHVPQGGSILQLDELPDPVEKNTLRKMARGAGETLMKAYGSIGEFSMDIGCDRKGNYYLFEVNSKPMRFDEPDIREKNFVKLVASLTAESGF